MTKELVDLIREITALVHDFRIALRRDSAATGAERDEQKFPTLEDKP